jgi:alkanesulfonate monooxygenase SsuD/methylene tetrahydromethanopterin reductase-like flavin-dependent oxidoreductase (luciferase family)
VVLGVGAGWQEREHTNFGFDLLELGPRFDRFEEGLEVITRLLREDQPVNFRGDYYQLQEAVLLPRPERPGGTRVLIGGNGMKKTLPLVARYADEWNGVGVPAARYAELNAHLTNLLAAEGRDPASVRRSLMTNVIFGRDDHAVQTKLAGRDPAELAQRGVLQGTGAAIQDQLGQLADAGAARVMLQWMDLDDLAGLEAFAAAVL